MKKLFTIFYFLLMTVCFIKIDASASVACLKPVVEEYEAQYKSGTDKAGFIANYFTLLKNCRCFGDMLNKADATHKSGYWLRICNEMRKELATTTDKAVTDKLNSLTATYGAKYTLSNTIGDRDFAYRVGMSEIWGLIKGVLNIVIGATLFILGFAFLWNLSQMGVHSSNPQARQEFISRLGDVFATALFIGLIPLVLQFVTSIIAGFSA